MPDIIDYKTIFTIFHLLGVAVGAGGAYASDLMFLSAIKDQKISKTEFRFLRLGSHMVWGGLVILVLSGAGLFALDPLFYSGSTKFLAKLTIVAVIAVNGAIFHFSHIPRIARHAGEHFPSADEFMRKRPLLILSGVISIVSWTAAIVLGAFRGVPFSYWQIMGAYALVTLLSVIFGLWHGRHLLPHHRAKINSN